MAWQRRLAKDLADLQENGWGVLPDGPEGSELQLDCFRVRVLGPPDTPYAGYAWHVRFTISQNFPFSSPSVGFVEKILHPNVDWASGSICLDALSKKWSPIFTLRHIVESLLVYLLAYPNPDDPLNRDAAGLMRDNPTAYAAKVLEATKRYGIKVTEQNEQPKV